MRSTVFRPVPAVCAVAGESRTKGRIRRVSAAKSISALPSAGKLAMRSKREVGLRARKADSDYGCCVLYAPKHVPAKALVLFLAGFTQTHKEYETLIGTCCEEGIVVLAPETDPVDLPARVLQENIVHEGEFWLGKVLNGGGPNPELKKFLPEGDYPVGILGQSLGGGLSLYVASQFPQVRRVAALAPFQNLTSSYDPKKVFEGAEFGSVHREVLVYTGGQDCIVKKSDVESKIIHPLSSLKEDGKAAYKWINVPCGAHTLYQDTFNLPLGDIVKVLIRSLGALIQSKITKPGPDTQQEEDIAKSFEIIINEGPGLLWNWLQLFNGVLPVTALFLALLYYGHATGSLWLQIVSFLTLAFGVFTYLVGQLSRCINGQPKELSKNVAHFFLHGIEHTKAP